MTSMIAMAVLMCCVGKSVQQFTAYAATGMIDVYSPFTAVEPIFTSNVNRFGYQMDQSPLAINSQLDETYRLAALYWFLRRMYAPVGRVYGPPPPPIAPNRLPAAAPRPPAQAKPASPAPAPAPAPAVAPPEGAKPGGDGTAPQEGAKPEGDGAKPEGDAAAPAVGAKPEGDAAKPEGEAAPES